MQVYFLEMKNKSETAENANSDEVSEKRYLNPTQFLFLKKGSK